MATTLNVEAALAESDKELAELESKAGKPNLSLWRTGKEIGEQVPSEIPWQNKPITVRGAITQLHGIWKETGKTTLALDAARHSLDGTKFLENPAAQTAVVYLTELDGITLRKELGDANLLDREDFYVTTVNDIKDLRAWPEVVEQAALMVKHVNAKLLIIDTWNDFSGIDDETQPSETKRAIRPLRKLAIEDKVAVLIIHHDRKSGGRTAVSSRGTGALSAACDINVQMSNPDPEDDNNRARILKVQGRFAEYGGTMMVLWNDRKEYELLASGTQLALYRAKREIEEVFRDPDNLSTSFTRDEIAKQAWGIEKMTGTQGRAFQALLTDGTLIKVGGKARSPKDPERFGLGTLSVLQGGLRERVEHE